MKIKRFLTGLSLNHFAAGALLFAVSFAWGQLVDRNQTPNRLGEGIPKTFEQEIGAGRGDVFTPGSSLFIINRDPFRAIRRGRQLFQRKFIRAQGQGPRDQDGIGNIEINLGLGAGLGDACATCHGRPRGAAGFGGDVVTRPDSRDAPHLFGLGLKEMLADEITADLRRIRDEAGAAACRCYPGASVTRSLTSKGINYGSITARKTGYHPCKVTYDFSKLQGVSNDLRVRPFFHHGGTISMREFIVGAFQAEMGLQPVDSDLVKAQLGQRIVTPSGMVLDGSIDSIEASFAQDVAIDEDNDGVFNEIPISIIDFLEYYFLNYFKAGHTKTSYVAQQGRCLFAQMGCASCHKQDLLIERDRRSADFETNFDPVRGISFNRLFGVATAQVTEINDGSGFPVIKKPLGRSFLVRDIFTDFKRHDLGPNFHEREYDSTIRRELLTTALWGVGSTPPYGHDGRSINLQEVILRHGGEAQAARNSFANSSPETQEKVIAFLNTLIIFPPDDTPSNLDPGNVATPGFPQFGHGAFRLGVLFNDPTDPE